MKDWQRIILLGLITLVSSGFLWLVAGTRVIYENFDGPYYAVVAKCLYESGCISRTFSFPIPLEYYPAHFPLYPLLMRGMEFLGVMRAGVIINLISSMAGAGTIYWIWGKMKWKNGFWTALVWLFIWPRMWVVRSVASPEALFITLTLISLYFFSIKKYWYSGVLGALAVATKSPGILLFGSYCVWFIYEFIKKKKLNLNIYPVLLIPITLLGIFYFYQLKTGDFWAYFNSGDNIHLQLTPFKVFDSTQAWVGTFWLEDVLWVYLVATVGVVMALRKNETWGIFGLVFLTTIFFVSHRDISRYSLPIVPVVLLGLGDLLQNKTFKYVFVLLLVPMFFYSLNFLNQNTVNISNWAPFL